MRWKKKNMKKNDAKKRDLTCFISVASVGFLFQPITVIPRSVASKFRSISSVHNTAINLPNNMKQIPSALLLISK